MRILFTVLISLFIIACGGADGSISVRADKVDEDGNFYVPADGSSFVELTISLSSKGGDVFDGTDVIIKTDKGTFGSSAGKPEIKLKSVNAKVTAKLYSTIEKGKANVNIKFIDPYSGTSIEKAIIVLFSNLEVGKKLSACNFSILCDKKNVPAFREKNLSIKCRVTTQDRNGNDIIVPDVKFMIEGDTAQVVKKGNGEYILEVDAQADTKKSPKDVNPLGWDANPDKNECKKTFGSPDYNLLEPCRIDPIEPKVRNPRDGLVTIVAYSNGENCFKDLNSNGTFDQGEPVEDQGEPYVDANDNGQYDPDEIYADVFDFAGSVKNKRDAKDGRYSENVPIFTSTKVLFTGLYDENLTGFKLNGTLYNGTIDAPALTCGGRLDYTFEIMDKNMNPLHGKGEKENVTIKTSGNTIAATATGRKFRDTMGMEIGDNGEISFLYWKRNTIFPVELISRPKKKECEQTGKKYKIEAEYNSNTDSSSGAILQKFGIGGSVN